MTDCASSGLIELKPHTGAYVARLTHTSLVEMFEMMAVLESACARLAARRHLKADRQTLEAAHEGGGGAAVTSAQACQQGFVREPVGPAGEKVHRSFYV